MRFELAYRLKRPATYIYFFIFFLLSFLAITTDAVIIGGSSGKVFLNSPYVVGTFVTILSIFAVFVVSAVMGVPVYRDLEHKTATFFFTLPFNRNSYLAGRFFGSFVVLFAIMLSIAAGILLGSVMPWLDAEKVGPTVWMAYVNSYFYIMLPNLLFASGIFFSLVALTRRIVAAYTGSAVLFVCYLMSTVLMQDIENQRLAALIDPFALSSFQQITQYWTVSEKNTLALPLTQELLYNRLIFGGLGLLMLAVCFVRFDVGRFAGFAGRTKKAPLVQKERSADSITLPRVAQRFGLERQFGQMLHLGRLEFANIARDILFLSMLFATLIFLLLDGWHADSMFGTTTYPVTYNMMGIAGQTFGLLMYAILIFFSGELVWRERSLGFSGITDSFPVGNWVYQGAKFLALAGICVLLCCLVIVSGVLVQALKGYYTFELGLYLQEVFLYTLPGYLIFATLCFFFHSLLNNKFLSFFIIILFMVGMLVLGIIDFSHPIYRFNQTPGYVYSDMNGYGHFMQGWGWGTAYWAAFGLLLVMLSNLLWLRGSETGFRNRLRLMGQRFGRSAQLLVGGSLLLWLALGGWLFYNTNVLNDYLPGDKAEELASAYEKQYKQYENRPQPKITAVSLQVDLYPESIAASIRGSYELENKTATPIDTLFVQLTRTQTLEELLLDGQPLQESGTLDATHQFHIYPLAIPLQPGEKRSLRFRQTYAKQGFVAGREQHNLVANGTFFNNGLLPHLGYDPGKELSEADKRKEQKLPERQRVPDLDDSSAWHKSFLGQDADWIAFEATISTSPGQIAVAPGYLEREWEEGGRKYYHYKMDAPILCFFSILSARYEVLKDEWTRPGSEPVAIEIFYHKGHEYNLARMVEGIKASLDYFTAHFGPYQHRQVRILEFPRYEGFAQSFPNTIPYSESLGFIARIKEGDPKDIDYPYYITAHEVAHQWWGHQVVPAPVQGAALLSETFSQYSALMVMKHKYGEDKMQRFLRYELDRYLSGRSFEQEKELPLYRAENQGYLHYRKGSLVMYALQDYLGEATVNRALRRLVDSVAFTEPPYPTSRAFLKIMKEETPDSLQYLVEDMFEKITLFENKATAATARQVGQEWEVTFSFHTSKRYAGELGEEEETPMQDWVDIGIFTEKQAGGKTEQVPLHLKKHKLPSGQQTLTLRVSEKPLRAGIDPYNKLVDRNPGDNTIAIGAL
ncbi:ABC transporter permease/M1 family aminopeptidase [Cesiribacter andamanensis]|uniref:ABC-type transport system involved in multi-copper enzyme maturation, permease component n=1 Tax=Cesiribacter andamanensis AMV16 TaxID=1279009 RepID=M7N1K9_9BACT|nr:M1 family aminopeptidase [Cesiribacter andamanensis]EMR01177.1 ABC-type transport system involved in multi-copper enzyme maturation, permease component [Cesiribacter andamanensis AMV16]